MQEAVIKFGLDWHLLIAQAINFGILLFILWKFLYRPILNILDKRRSKIEEAQNFVEQITQEKEALDAKTSQIIEQARIESEKIMENAKKIAITESNNILEKANNASNQMLEKAKEEIEQEKQKMLKDVQQYIGELALQIARKVVFSSQINESAYKDAMHETLKR